MFCLIIFTLTFIPSLFFLFQFPPLTPLSHLLAVYHSGNMPQKGKLPLTSYQMPLMATLQPGLILPQLSWNLEASFTFYRSPCSFLSVILTRENATGKVNPTKLCFSGTYSALLGVILNVFMGFIFSQAVLPAEQQLHFMTYDMLLYYLDT